MPASFRKSPTSTVPFFASKAWSPSLPRTWPVCGEHPTITEPVDYEQFCGVPILDPKSLEETRQEVQRAKSPIQPQGAASGLDEKGLPPGYQFKPDWEVTPREVKAKLDK